MFRWSLSSILITIAHFYRMATLIVLAGFVVFHYSDTVTYLSSTRWQSKNYDYRK